MIPSLLTDTVTFDIERAVHYALLWGLEGVELRSVGGANDRIPFVNESKVRSRLRESELPAVAVGPAAFITHVDDRAAWMNDLVQLDETLNLCKRLGCERVVVSSFKGQDGSIGDPSTSLKTAVDALQRAGRKAAQKGITLCVLNEQGYLAPHGAGLADLLDAVDSDAVMAAWSPAEALLSGEDPNDGLRAIADRVALVRCRNGASKGNGWEPRSIDSGEIDWSAQLALLASAGFDGPVCLEVEAEPQAKAGLHDATALIRMLREVRSQVNT